MYKKNKIIIFLCIIILILITVIICLLNNKEELVIKEENFIDAGVYLDRKLKNGEYLIIESYSELNKIIEKTELKEDDFNNKKYVLLEINNDMCSGSIIPTSYNIDNNNLSITIAIKKGCGICSKEYVYYLLPVNKTEDINNVYYNYKYIKGDNCNDYEVKKPIIYIYPEKETDINIKLLNEELLTTSYPRYNNNWDIKAYPDGTLIDNKTNKKLYALYWEGIDNNKIVEEEGFIIEGKETSTFLEEKLSLLGLNYKEQEEFIIYWLPKLENNKYNYIRFERIEEINNYMPLEINPKPDTLIRIIMDYKPLDKKINIKKQELKPVTRKGFTVVEWGGTLIK